VAEFGEKTLVAELLVKRHKLAGCAYCASDRLGPWESVVWLFTAVFKNDFWRETLSQRIGLRVPLFGTTVAMHLSVL